jgi:hypothetical protein
MAAMVSLRKRSLENYRGRMPPPRRRGSRGRPNLWAWGDVRAWLEATFGRNLPASYPGMGG